MNERHTDTDYRDTLQRIYEHIGGLNVEYETSSGALAKELGVSPSAVGRIRTFAERIGGMSVRFKANMVDGEIRGRKAIWMFIHTPEWMLQRARDEWGFTAFDNANLETRMPGRGQKSRQKDAPKAPPAEPAPETQAAQGAAAIRTRITEPEALIAAIKQYMGREAFIEEKIAEFAEMGIEIDVDAIKFEPSERYEFAIPLVEHIEKQERTLDRLRARQADTAQAERDKGTIQEFQRELGEAREDLRKARSAMEALQQEYRVKSQAQDRRIRELEAALQREATKNLQQAAQA